MFSFNASNAILEHTPLRKHKSISLPSYLKKKKNSK